MALFIFTKSILSNKPIKIFNKGNMIRDFTYVDDIVEGIVRVLKRPATALLNFDQSKPSPANSIAPYRLFNIGNNNPVKLMDYIYALEKALSMTAIKNYLPMQPGDVPRTNSNTDKLKISDFDINIFRKLSDNFLNFLFVSNIGFKIRTLLFMGDFLIIFFILFL